jgi:hypothetical protein
VSRICCYCSRLVTDSSFRCFCPSLRCPLAFVYPHSTSPHPCIVFRFICWVALISHCVTLSLLSCVSYSWLVVSSIPSANRHTLLRIWLRLHSLLIRPFAIITVTCLFRSPLLLRPSFSSYPSHALFVVVDALPFRSLSFIHASLTMPFLFSAHFFLAVALTIIRFAPPPTSICIPVRMALFCVTDAGK